MDDTTYNGAEFQLFTDIFPRASAVVGLLQEGYTDTAVWLLRRQWCDLQYGYEPDHEERVKNAALLPKIDALLLSIDPEIPDRMLDLITIRFLNQMYDSTWHHPIRSQAVDALRRGDREHAIRFLEDFTDDVVVGKMARLLLAQHQTQVSEKLVRYNTQQPLPPKRNPLPMWMRLMGF